MNQLSNFQYHFRRRAFGTVAGARFAPRHPNSVQDNGLPEGVSSPVSYDTLERPKISLQIVLRRVV